MIERLIPIKEAGYSVRSLALIGASTLVLIMLPLVRVAGLSNYSALLPLPGQRQRMAHKGTNLRIIRRGPIKKKAVRPRRVIRFKSRLVSLIKPAKPAGVSA